MRNLNTEGFLQICQAIRGAREAMLRDHHIPFASAPCSRPSRRSPRPKREPHSYPTTCYRARQDPKRALIHHASLPASLQPRQPHRRASCSCRACPPRPRRRRYRHPEVLPPPAARRGRASAPARRRCPSYLPEHERYAVRPPAPPCVHRQPQSSSRLPRRHRTSVSLPASPPPPPPPVVPPPSCCCSAPDAGVPAATPAVPRRAPRSTALRQPRGLARVLLRRAWPGGVRGGVGRRVCVPGAGGDRPRRGCTLPSRGDPAPTPTPHPPTPHPHPHTHTCCTCSCASTHPPNPRAAAAAGQPRPPARQATLPRCVALDRPGDDSPHGEYWAFVQIKWCDYLSLPLHCGPWIVALSEEACSQLPLLWPRPAPPAPPPPCRSSPTQTRRRAGPSMADATATPVSVSLAAPCVPLFLCAFVAGVILALVRIHSACLPTDLTSPTPLCCCCRCRRRGTGVESIAPLEARLRDAGIAYTASMSGRPAIFFRDPGESGVCVCVARVACRQPKEGGLGSGDVGPALPALPAAPHVRTSVSQAGPPSW